jgi:hypothetical protein
VVKRIAKQQYRASATRSRFPAMQRLSSRLSPCFIGAMTKRLLAGSPHGCTEETLRAHGFTVRLLARIVRARLAVTKPEIVKAGGRTLSMLRLTITDTGRQALAGA